MLHRGDPGDELASGSLGDQDQVYKLIMSPAEAAALQPRPPPRANDRGGDDTVVAVQRATAENLPLGPGGAPWQGE